MPDLRSNPFQEEGNDTILVRLVSNDNYSTRALRIHQMILRGWVEIDSKMLTLELKSSHRNRDHLCGRVINKAMFRFMMRLQAYARRYEHPSMERSLRDNTRQHESGVAMRQHELELSFYIAVTSGPITTLIHLESFKSQRMKVVDLFLSFPEHLESSQSEFGCESYGHFSKGRRSRILDHQSSAPRAI